VPRPRGKAAVVGLTVNDGLQTEGDDILMRIGHRPSLIAAEAERAMAMIAQIGGEAAHLDRLHRCYERYDRMTAEKDELLTGPPLEIQVDVLKRQASIDGAEYLAPRSCRSAHGALLGNPSTNRMPLPRDAGTFNWIDRDGVEHQLDSPILIEREYIAFAKELTVIASSPGPGSSSPGQFVQGRSR